MDVEVRGAPTLRERDGLAMSSRNENLDPEARAQATALVRALDAAEAAVAAGERDAARLLHVARTEIEKSARAVIDYAELRDPETLKPAPASLESETLLALAVFMRPVDGGEGGVRLIDNRVLAPSRDFRETPQ